jgi:hypothetical protein
MEEFRIKIDFVFKCVLEFHFLWRALVDTPMGAITLSITTFSIKTLSMTIRNDRKCIDIRRRALLG